MWRVTDHLDLEWWVSLEWLSYLPSFLFSVLILSVFLHCHKTLCLNITICKAGFIHLGFFAILHSLWDLSSPTRNWTQATAMKELILITGPSGKSLYPLNVHSTVNYNSVREKEQKSSKRYRQNHKAYPWKTAHGPGYDRDSAFNSWRQRHEEMWDHEREQNQGHRSAMGLDTPPGQGTGKEDAIH